MDLEDLFGGGHHRGRHGHRDHDDDHRHDDRGYRRPDDYPRDRYRYEEASQRRDPVSQADPRDVRNPQGQDPQAPGPQAGDPRDPRDYRDRDYRDRDYRDPRDYRDHRSHHSSELDLSHMAHRLMANKGLLIVAGLVLLALVVLFFVFVLPLLGQAVDYVGENGLKGAVDKVWEGQSQGKSGAK